MRGRKNEEEGQVGVAGRPVKLSSDIKLTRKMCRQTTIQFWEMDGMVDLYPSFSLSYFRSLYTMPATLYLPIQVHPHRRNKEIVVLSPNLFSPVSMYLGMP